MTTDEFLEECESIVERLDVLARSMPEGAPVQKVVQELGADVWGLTDYAVGQEGLWYPIVDSDIAVPPDQQ